MAVLSLDTLSGCSSIPSFIGGSADTPANPSKMIFNNTNAPVNWVKDTTHNNKSLRIIGGANGSAISVGGTIGFTTVFSPRTKVITSGISTSNISIASTVTGYPTTTNPGGSASQPATVSTDQIAPHIHPIDVSTLQSQPTGFGPGGQPAATGVAGFIDSGPGGGPASHPHTTTGSITSHTHPITETAHRHPLTSTGPHSHSLTLNQDFSILYIDVIIATKS